MTKRIAFLTDHADPLAPLGSLWSGGENVYVNELTRALSRFGWTIDVFTRWASPKTTKIAKITPNVRVIRLKAGPIEYVDRDKLFATMPEYVENFLSFKRENKLEYLLLHGNYYFSGWAGVQISRILKIPMVNTFHTLGVVRHMAIGKRDASPDDRVRIEKEVMNGVDRIIATSPVMKDEMQRYYEPTKKITVVPGGVNLKRFEPLSVVLARRVLNINTNRMIVLFVGRMEERKGIDTLLYAIDLLAKMIPEKRKILRCYIVGGQKKSHWKKDTESPEARELQRLYGIVEKLGIKDIVRFVGGEQREFLPYYYAAADVTVVPSYYEPFGLVPLESMACGTPVVASKVGGMQWTIKDGKTGYLVPPLEPKGFADKLAYLFSHAAVRKHMRENGVDRVNRLFGWEAVASQMSALYNDIIIENFYRQLFGKQNGNGGNGK